MINQMQHLLACSELTVFALAGICACVPGGAAPIERERSTQGSDIEGHIYNDELDNDRSGPGSSSQPGSTGSSGASLQADFNGDGYADLAIGVPYETLDGVEAGGVNVLYGSASGLTAAGDQFWDQGRTGVLGEPGEYDNFGLALATGDFNLDGYADLAIGVPFDDSSSVPAGAVNVLYGSGSGLTTAGNQIWHQDSPGIEGVAQHVDGFGYALATGDFDGDGYHDLAVGVPFDGLSGGLSAGSVNIIYGSSGGLSAAGNQLWNQDTPNVDGVAEPFDLFGGTLAAGDFNNDGRDDLVIGVPREDVGSIFNAGWINLLYGSNSGLTGDGDQHWHQNSDGIKGLAEADDEFGSALAVGDFDNDGYADLAIGTPFEDVGSLTDAGAINIIYGSNSGLTDSGDQYWHQNTPGVDGVADPGDFFGWALAAGHFNNDGRADLAVGVPGENLGSINNAGLVNLLYGSNSGLTGSGDQLWHQNINGVRGVAEAGDFFGSALSVANFNADGTDDLVIAVPSEDVGTIEDAGAINVLYGDDDGLTDSGDQVWHQDSADVANSAEKDDGFGGALP